MVTRRKFLKAGAAGTAVAVAPAALLPKAALAASCTPGPVAVLDGLQQFNAIKFTTDLPNPLDPSYVYLPTGINSQLQPKFKLEISQINNHQTGLVDPTCGTPINTTVWAYGAPGQPPVYPGRTFLAFQSRLGFAAYEVTYVNKLVDGNGQPLPSYMPIDNTIDWANPGGLGGLAPVPLVAHLHGGDNQYLSDGLPDAWSTPGDLYRGRLFSKPYTYDNTQEAGHLWYHDHALGVTRTNVYMGLAGHYLIRDVNELLLVALNKLPASPYEVPIVIQDRIFNSDGTLAYPSDPRGYPAAPEDANPDDPNDPFFSALEQATPTTHYPEFFGDVMLVNGKAWPKMDVEPRQYRFRVLNGSDSRVYTLKLVVADAAGNPTGATVPFYVIGDELGLLNKPASPAYLDPRDPGAGSRPNVLAIAPGERYDIVIDFQAFNGQNIIVTNDANEPFPDGDPAPDSVLQIMRFDVVKRLNRLRPRTTLSANTDLRIGSNLPNPDPATATNTRRLVLVEGTDGLNRLMTMIGPVAGPGQFNPADPAQGTQTFTDAITEKPTLNSTEIWEFYNTTVDAHPIHMHLVDFRILDRQVFDSNVVQVEPKPMRDGIIGGTLNLDSVSFTAPPVAPGPEEAGKKDTAIMYPGTVTRLLVTFKRRGEYVYHCHILSHEDHEMMRPYKVI